jgi:hypothetical protein
VAGRGIAGRGEDDTGGFPGRARMIRRDYAMAPSPPPSGPRRSQNPKRPSGDERVVVASDGRLWNASHRQGPGEGAIVFSCITESRMPARAIAVGSTFRLRDAGDGELLRLFEAAPAVGKLT